MKSKWLFFNLTAFGLLGLSGCFDTPESVIPPQGIANSSMTPMVSEQQTVYQYSFDQYDLDQDANNPENPDTENLDSDTPETEGIFSLEEDPTARETAAIAPSRLSVNEQDQEQTTGSLKLDIHLLKKNHLLTHHFPLDPKMIQAGRELHVSYRCVQCKARKSAYLWWIDVNRNGEYEPGEPLRAKTKSYKIQMKDRGQRLALKVSIQSSTYDELSSHRFYEVLFQQQNRLW